MCCCVCVVCVILRLIKCVVCLALQLITGVVCGSPTDYLCGVCGSPTDYLCGVWVSNWLPVWWCVRLITCEVCVVLQLMPVRCVLLHLISYVVCVTPTDCM